MSHALDGWKREPVKERDHCKTCLHLILVLLQPLRPPMPLLALLGHNSQQVFRGLLLLGASISVLLDRVVGHCLVAFEIPRAVSSILDLCLPERELRPELLQGLKDLAGGALIG